jgi:non-specific serine/threonine protein kinase
MYFAEAHQIINVDVHPDTLLPFIVLPEQHDHFLKRLRSHIPINWKLYLNTPKNQVKRGALHTTYSSTSGIDWLDIEATFRHPDSDSSHTLADIMQVYTPGDQFLTLGESSYLIDDTTSQTLNDLAMHYRPSTKSIRMHQSHVGLLDELTSLCGEEILPPQWKTSLDTYRNFTRITPRTLPSTLTATLRPYQQEGVHWLSFLRDFRFGGILADDMGLGKTIQAISILALSHQDAKPIHPSLIVAPTSVVANWQRECARFAPTLRTYLYAEKDRALPPSGTVDIIITSYALLWRDADIFTPLQFHYVVLDEAHYIKNHTSRTSQTARKLNAEYRLSLTGTPLENNLSELWAQSAFINPSLLGTYEEFKKSYLNPIQKEQSTQAKKKLQTMMKPFLLRRLKDQVAHDLPPKVESVQWVHMEPKQRKLYNQLKKHFQEKVHGIIHKKGIQKSQIEILEALLRLRQACCHPLLLTELTDTLKKNGFKSIDAATVRSAKYEAALDLIGTAAQEGHKILVFSQFVRMIDILAKGLADRSVSHTSLTGSTKNRQAVIDAYQSPNGPSVFLLSLKAGGTGLNLTAADYVVHFDPWWNPAVEAQATDRAHRIGQQKRVFVYKFLVKDSIEEKILKLQEKKKELIQDIIGATSGPSGLTREDIDFLFT